MTIDEAQIMLKAKAKCIERICKGIYEDCNEQKCDNCDLCYAQGTNGDQIELMLQCGEWLEELKAYREIGTVEECRNNILDIQKAYNKAIDDCEELTFREVVYCDSLNDRTEFREMAEQLKVGGENDKSI